MNDRVEDAMLKMEAGADPEEIASEISEELNPEGFFEEKKPTGKQDEKIRYDESLYELQGEGKRLAYTLRWEEEHEPLTTLFQCCILKDYSNGLNFIGLNLSPFNDHGI